MTKRSPWNAIRTSLRQAADPSVADQYARIAPTTGPILGIKVPVIRNMVKQFAASAKELSVSDAAEMADHAFASRCREEMLFATFLLARYKKKLEPAHWPRLDNWIDRIDNWEACDQLAMGIAGEMVARAQEPYRGRWVEDLETWASAANPWRRRFAVASTTVLNQKGRADATTALRICERVVTDSDKNVRKAIGWALREACKSDSAMVFAFLKRHQSTMPRAVLRESAQKLSTSQRAALGVG